MKRKHAAHRPSYSLDYGLSHVDTSARRRNFLGFSSLLEPETMSSNRRHSSDFSRSTMENAARRRHRETEKERNRRQRKRSAQKRQRNELARVVEIEDSSVSGLSEGVDSVPLATMANKQGGRAEAHAVETSNDTRCPEEVEDVITTTIPATERQKRAAVDHRLTNNTSV